MTKILVVEDERIVARDLCESLERMGYDVVGSASSCEEALQYASEKAPALVMMDIRISGEIDGVATAEVLRSRFDIPVIYLTAYADDATLARAKHTAPLGYIVKPFKSAELKGAIEMALVRHELERRIRERGHWFSTTLRSVVDGVLAIDPDGAVQFANPSAESVLGVASVELLARPIDDVVRLVAEKGREALPNPVRRAIQQRKTTRVPDHALLDSAPHAPPIEGSAAPIVDENQRLLGAVMVFRDVSEQRRVEMRAALNDRLTALGTLVAGVAHELNNPLTALFGHSELIQTELDALSSSAASPSQSKQVERLRRHASAIAETARTMGDIVSDLRLFSSPQPDMTEAVDVREVLDSALRRTSALIRERAMLTCEFENAPPASASKRRLMHVFINLLTNAAQAIPPGKRASNEVLVRLDSSPAGDVRITVRDTGAGMSPEVARQVFDPFFTTKPLGEGAGLGLAITYGIVRSFHGEISVRSEVGAGSVFVVTLPSAETAVRN